MATYVMLTRLSPDAISEPDSIDELGQKVIDKLNAECPEANVDRQLCGPRPLRLPRPLRGARQRDRYQGFCARSVVRPRHDRDLAGHALGAVSRSRSFRGCVVWWRPPKLGPLANRPESIHEPDPPSANPPRTT